MKKFLVAACIVALIFLAHWLALRLVFDNSRLSHVTPVYNSLGQDISVVSFSPAITEMVYLLGLEDYLAGVTAYCVYPEPARSKQKIGGYYDPNMELVLRIAPDYALIGTEHEALSQRLQRMGIEPVVLDASTPDSILESLRKIAGLFNIQDKAEEVINQLENRIKYLENAVKELPRPRVMLVFGEQMGGGSTNTRCVVGDDLFYTPLIELAGGVNVVTQSAIKYPMISDEAVLRLNPDIIIELIYSDAPQPVAINEIMGPWKHLNQVNAVKNQQIYVMTADYIFIPGPRFVSIAETFFSILHPQQENTGDHDNTRTER
ncbi:MAG: helical backbone metal receptor [Candidatus Auribacterota bacterium]|jgi:iron complex transport system substrate-binding protein|nr:helical backbone metal receptor [Candidatus Auribacterota bacterium]